MLQFFARHHLQPIDSQVPVGCYSPLRLGTAVDVVCLDAAGRVWIVELKTGYKNNYRHFCGPLQAPFAAFDDCPYHQHQIQLLLTVELYRHMFPGVRVGGAAVVRVVDDGTVMYPLLAGMQQRIDACLATIVAAGRLPYTPRAARGRGGARGRGRGRGRGPPPEKKRRT